MTEASSSAEEIKLPMLNTLKGTSLTPALKPMIVQSLSSLGIVEGREVNQQKKSSLGFQKHEKSFIPLPLTCR